MVGPRISVVIQGLRLNILAVIQYMAESNRSRLLNFRSNGLPREEKLTGKEKSLFFIHVFYIAWQQKMHPELKVDLSTSKDLDYGWTFTPQSC